MKRNQHEENKKPKKQKTDTESDTDGIESECTEDAPVPSFLGVEMSKMPWERPNTPTLRPEENDIGLKMNYIPK